MERLTDRVQNAVDTKSPFSLLSNVILYRSDNTPQDLFANEIDFLIHSKTNDLEDRLIIVEIKQRKVFGSAVGEPPRPEGPWQLNYYKDGPQSVNQKTKDIKKQVSNQILALGQFCRNIDDRSPTIEAWIVDEREGPPEYVVDKGNERIALLTFSGFKDRLEKLDRVVGINQSKYLRQLRYGTPLPEIGHPELPNALRFIKVCRKCLDDQLFSLFEPKIGFHALNGCAGMGKSVLLAYCIYVFATDKYLSNTNQRLELKPFDEKARKIGIPKFGNRNIYAFAVKMKQVETLERYWRQIRDQIRSINPTFMPATRTPKFRQWNGSIPDDCNILVIDEAHDLEEADQSLICDWIKNQKSSDPDRYLAVACDRNQASKRSENDQDIISGLNFSGHATRLNRIYRCPFPVYVASLGLLFRWFYPSGVGVHLTNQKLREHFGFFPKVELDGRKMLLSMRNDCHPGNNWRQTVGGFEKVDEAFWHLKQYELKREDVLWAGFSKTDQDFDYMKIQMSFTFVDLRGSDFADEIDKYIKGQEFSIVVVEGFPHHMNPPSLIDEGSGKRDVHQDEIAMWRIRRSLYIVCSRALAFLYFIEDPDSSSESNNLELKSLLRQVSRPTRREHESGQTWHFEVMLQEVTRKPTVFRDIENALLLPEKIDCDGVVLTVENVASWFGVSEADIQRILPNGAKAKHDRNIVIRSSHIPIITNHFGYAMHEDGKTIRKLKG